MKLVHAVKAGVKCMSINIMHEMSKTHHIRIHIKLNAKTVDY